jgi:hypothetical protein
MAEEPVPTAEEPVVEAEPQPAAREPEPVAAAAAPAADELPEEQPFERGGRWWFKRGDELLVYEEQTGQWATAPEGAFAAASGAGAAFQPSTEEVSTQQATPESVTSAAPPSDTEASPLENTGTLGAISDETATAWRTDDTPAETADAATVGAGEPEPAAADTSLWGLGESTAPSEETGATEASGGEGEATFWKCASCGAVNGSTASTCRMCFAKRP